MNENQFGGSFWITITGLLLSGFGAAGYYALKSKCIECSLCWGAIVIKRDVLAENQAEEMELENGIAQPAQPSLNQR